MDRDHPVWPRIVKGAIIVAQDLARTSAFLLTVAASSVAVHMVGDRVTRRCSNWTAGKSCGVWADFRLVRVDPRRWKVVTDVTSCGSCSDRFDLRSMDARLVIMRLPVDWSGDVLDLARVQSVMDV